MGLDVAKNVASGGVTLCANHEQIHNEALTVIR
jgi:hypothetical protein